MPLAPPVVASSLSKNRRDQLEKEVAHLEQKIASAEGELAELELSFQNPATGTDWESTHKRYADLKVILEGSEHPDKALKLTLP